MIKNFEELLNELRNGKTFEQICSNPMVECVENVAYEDDDLYEYLYSIGIRFPGIVKTYNKESYILLANTRKTWAVPYEVAGNRFDDCLEDETILIFDYERIKEVK